MHNVFIDYDKLIEDYWHGLNTKLRGFTASDEEDFLEAWVPEENDLHNILNILNEALQHDIKKITIRFSPAIFHKIGKHKFDKFILNLMMWSFWKNKGGQKFSQKT